MIFQAKSLYSPLKKLSLHAFAENPRRFEYYCHRQLSQTQKIALT
jgi:hypothetical protein